MTVTAVVGVQYGDEGKGRVVDYLAHTSRMVIRFQGGDNAGHTIVNQFGTFRLHLVPSGIFHPGTACVIGTGTVINPDTLLTELSELSAAGVSLDSLCISDRAHLVMPYHKLLDGLEESSRGAQKIGTTKRGIGPAYQDKAARSGLRAGDLHHLDYLRTRLEQNAPRINQTLEYYGEPAVHVDELFEICRGWADKLGSRIIDTLPMVRSAVERGETILLEGQLGVMKDVDWGTYPFVTSSHPLAAYGSIGAGIPFQKITRVIGVCKAYATTVGAGPFPAELQDEIGTRIREIGREYGATTGRPRRCGWLDALVVRHAAWINGLTDLAITKLDVLDGFPEIKMCVAYRDKTGGRIETIPDPIAMETVEPIYETFTGWRSKTVGIRRWSDLPSEARVFLERLEKLADVPIRYVSVGPERDAMIDRS